MPAAWTDVATAYLRRPRDFWPEGRRQPEILEERRVEPESIIRLAETRRAVRPSTVFIVNCGSSGSHWFEFLMTASSRIAPCGEVYLPRLDVDDPASMWDAVHLAHADAPTVDSILVNSAHQWRPSNESSPARTLLLVRDPVDIALSRTFRKPELREQSHADTSDDDYLDLNCDVVARFFTTAAARRRPPDEVVRYEDLRADPVAVVCSAMSRIDAVDPGSVDALLRESESARKDPALAQRIRLYTGPAREIPAASVERAARHLAEVRRQWGYTSD